MDYYIHQCLKKVEKPEKLVPIVSAIAATSLVTYFVKHAISPSKSNDIRPLKGTEEIPTPKGAAFYLILQRQAENSVDQLIDQTKTHGYVNPFPFVRCSSINIILATSFGIPGVTSPEDPLFKQLEYVIERGIYFSGVTGDFSAYFPILSFLDIIFRKEKKMKDFVNNIRHPLFCKLIKAARESDQDSLVKKLDLIKDKYEIDEKNIEVILSEFFVAVSDTVAVTTSLTYAILCHHPEVQEKLAYEVDSFIRKHQRTPTFEDCLELPYYRSVQKECLRYRPPIYFGIPRKASNDVIYKNYVLPEGTTLVSNIYHLNNNPDTFPEPNKFIPERFMDDSRSMYASANGNICIENNLYLDGANVSALVFICSIQYSFC